MEERNKKPVKKRKPIKKKKIKMGETNLVTMDDEMTMTETQISQGAYEASQQALAKLIEALRIEASKIEGLGDDFRQMDEDLSLLVKLVTE